MQKWEYLSLTASFRSGAWRPHWQNGIEFENWENFTPVHDYINALGAEGWELVSEIYDPNIEGTKWKYRDLQIPPDWKGIRYTDREFKGNEEIMEWVGQHGENRWELAGMTSTEGLSGATNSWQLIFKCPITDEVMRLRFKRPQP